MTKPINAIAIIAGSRRRNIALLNVSLGRSSDRKLGGLPARHFSEQLYLFLIGQGQVLDDNRISGLLARGPSRSRYVAVNFCERGFKRRKQRGRNQGPATLNITHQDLNRGQVLLFGIQSNLL